MEVSQPANKNNQEKIKHALIHMLKCMMFLLPLIICIVAQPALAEEVKQIRRLFYQHGFFLSYISSCLTLSN